MHAHVLAWLQAIQVRALQGPDADENIVPPTSRYTKAIAFIGSKEFDFTDYDGFVTVWNVIDNS